MTVINSKHKKRYNALTSSQETGNRCMKSNGDSMLIKKHQPSPKKNIPVKEAWSILSVLNVILGLIAMLTISYAHVAHSYQIHENQLWFSNIKEVEREISFRTESGLYYSYFKQLVWSPSFFQGLKDLTEDKITEHPDTINILKRMNIYQEVILAFLYKTFQPKMAPIMFYINFVFFLQGLLVSGLFLMTWLLSNSWLAGLLASTFYLFNHNDTTRVSNAMPLRECFSLPFLWVQAAALTIYFKPRPQLFQQHSSLVVVAASTFLFCLFWQFNQFIMMLQAFAFFGVWILDIIPAFKVRNVMLCQLGSLVLVYLLQFGNTMILGSWAVSFILVSLAMISFKSREKTHSLCYNVSRVVGLSLLSLVLMFVLSSLIKAVLKIDADEHIFTFLSDKFTQRETRNFDSRIYLCLQIFGFITQDVFERLTTNLVLPLYLPSHFVLLTFLVFTVIRKWRSPTPQLKDDKKSEENTAVCYFDQHPELAFHVVQAVFFGALAIITLRMKYFWTPYICVLASAGLGSVDLWAGLLRFTKTSNKFLITGNILRSSILVLAIAAVTGKLLPGVLKDLEGKYEFWDPDTVELMEWIVNNTKLTASFTGSMQLLAGVKLCTLRPITNHPHYEDKYLRQKTKQLYQIYGKQPPELVHQILKKYKSDYIILEDSICRAPSRDGCRTPDIVDIDNGVMPDDYFKIQDLVVSKTLRFCEAVRHQTHEYVKYFRTVFVNKTFRIYKVV